MKFVALVVVVLAIGGTMFEYSTPPSSYRITLVRDGQDAVTLDVPSKYLRTNQKDGDVTGRIGVRANIFDLTEYVDSNQKDQKNAQLDVVINAPFKETMGELWSRAYAGNYDFVEKDKAISVYSLRVRPEDSHAYLKNGKDGLEYYVTCYGKNVLCYWTFRTKFGVLVVALFPRKFVRERRFDFVFQQIIKFLNKLNIQKAYLPREK